jgi:large subunit ribosomal protein L17
MRHKVDGRKLGRTASHRKAMLANMAVSLLKHERIETTLAKAKELRRFVEPIITRAKEDSVHNKRMIRRKISDRKIINKLFENIVPRYTNRNGGYTRIIKLSKYRNGDNSRMALIELVEEALYTNTKKKKAKKDTTAPKVEEKVESKTTESEVKPEDTKSPEAESDKSDDQEVKAEVEMATDQEVKADESVEKSEENKSEDKEEKK